MKIKLFVETQNNQSGNKRARATYPMFSNWACMRAWKYTDSENGECVLYRKITIEDGEFKNGWSKNRKFDKYSYVGQHTNLDIDLQNGICENAPRFIYGDLFCRNKYGGQLRQFRLDLVRCVLQIQRGKNKKWCDFEPAVYID